MKQLHSAKNKTIPRQTGKHQHLLTFFFFFLHILNNTSPHKLKKKKNNNNKKNSTKNRSLSAFIFIYDKSHLALVHCTSIIVKSIPSLFIVFYDFYPHSYHKWCVQNFKVFKLIYMINLQKWKIIKLVLSNSRFHHFYIYIYIYIKPKLLNLLQFSTLA